MAHQGLAERRPASPKLAAALQGDPTPEEMISIGEAARIVGRTPRTVERWFDKKQIAGGRPCDPITGVPLLRSHRWIDARYAVLIAVKDGRAHLVPEQWRYLIRLFSDPAPSERRHTKELSVTAS